MLKKLASIAVAMALGIAVVATASMIDTAPPRATVGALAAR